MISKIGNKYRIEYLGKVLNTSYWEPLSDEIVEEAKKEYFARPSFEEVKSQLLNVSKGSSKINLINRYYFRDVMAKVRLNYNKWTISEVFDNKELVEFMSAKMKQNQNVYKPEWSLATKMYKMFAIAGKRFASPPTLFPLPVVDRVLSKYNVNGNWYDFSCGWGTRLLGALRNGVNYHGTDPNTLLCERLEELKRDYVSVCGAESNVEVVCGGSETFHPEWENKIGIAFSSPPYFDLEDYSIGDGQSFKPGMSYREWISGYAVPTMLNIWKYLVPGGFFIVNIKNIGKHRMADNWREIANRIGFEFVGTDSVEVHPRCFGTPNGNGKYNVLENDEDMFIFRKPL